MRNPIMVSFILLLGACEEPATEQLVLSPLTRPSEAPEVGFDLGDGETWVTPGTLSGFVADRDQAASTVPIVIDSAIDGELYRGNANGDGEWSWQGELSPGDNPLQVTATDREGNLSIATVLAQVRTNEVPTCQIDTPVDGAEVRVRTDVTFSAQVSDGDGDPLEVLWRSDLEGALANGPVFVRRLRQVGRHTISLEVRDNIGEPCTDSIVLVVVD